MSKLLMFPRKREKTPAWIENSETLRDKHFSIPYDVSIFVAYDGSIEMYEIDGQETAREGLVEMFTETQIRNFETRTLSMLK